eukprot:Em0019g1159a
MLYSSYKALTSAVRMSYQGTGGRPDLNNHSNQLNPNNPQHGGGAQRPAGSSDYQGAGDRADLNNHSNQLNPNHQQFGGGAAGGAARR